MALKVHLVLIDCQNSFMGNDDGSPYTVGNQIASLPVKGAISDLRRLSKMVDRVGGRLEDIHVTLDSHRVIDVSHPSMWRNVKGDSPSPFTMITPADMDNDIWYPRDPSLRPRMRRYLQTLYDQGSYPHMIWNEHCLIGSWGHNVQDTLAAALQRWERSQFANVDYVVKGTNPYTEHFGALMAEVPDPNDPSTQLNGDFLKILQDADIIGVAGEASSHCVLETVKQIATNIGVEHVKKFHVILDCMSPVAQVPGGPDFPAIAAAFFKDMESKGMILTTSERFLA